MKFSEIAQRIGLTEQSSLAEHPEVDPEISQVMGVQDAEADAITYIEGAKFIPYVATTQAGALILPPESELQAQAIARNIAWISVKDPRLAFAQTIPLFYQPFHPPAGIHPTAVIDESVVLGEGVAIAAHAVIEAGAKIGDGVRIHPNVVVYPEVTIGDRTVLHANCVIHERSQLGADCVIHSGAAIGSEGFGFTMGPEGWVKIEQSGITILEDCVEIGCNTTVDRPAVGITRIGRNTKFDNQVHIGHNCEVGENCIMAAQVGLAGQVQVNDQVILGGQVGVANQVEIGQGVRAGAKTGIHNRVAPGSTILGSPAIPYREFLKCSAVFHRLPEMQRSLKALQRQVEDLQQQLL
ncbi:MAG: UDP-3-O-(3-hydroxymyristoyl)glucosamine N-acyltransferase, partial [Leptolyngbyaceae cyanobacterium]